MDRKIQVKNTPKRGKIVALRKESVDRKLTLTVPNVPIDSVALRKESVDRKLIWFNPLGQKPRRSPQGERG